jgi:hypothetical protein
MAGVPVTWTTTSGTVSPASSITDAGGLASAQWTPAGANSTLTATVAATRSTTFNATTSPPVACTINATSSFLTEGPTDYSVFTRGDGTVKAVMLLGDFPDLAATETPDAAAAAW